MYLHVFNNNCHSFHVILWVHFGEFLQLQNGICKSKIKLRSCSLWVLYESKSSSRFWEVNEKSDLSAVRSDFPGVWLWWRWAVTNVINISHVRFTFQTTAVLEMPSSWQEYIKLNICDLSRKWSRKMKSVLILNNICFWTVLDA